MINLKNFIKIMLVAFVVTLAMPELASAQSEPLTSKPIQLSAPSGPQLGALEAPEQKKSGNKKFGAWLNKAKDFVLGTSPQQQEAKEVDTSYRTDESFQVKAEGASGSPVSHSSAGLTPESMHTYEFGYAAPSIQEGPICKDGNVFERLSCKASSTLNDLRKVIYAIAGFGIIAFAFAAIFGKISWKHLAQISFSLFLVAMVGPFISYFTGVEPGTGTKLNFGNYLDSPAGGLIDGSVGLEQQLSSLGARNPGAVGGIDTVASAWQIQSEGLRRRNPGATTSTPMDLKTMLKDGTSLVKNVSTALRTGSIGVKDIGNTLKNGNWSSVKGITANIQNVTGSVQGSMQGIGNAGIGAGNAGQNMFAKTKEERAANQRQQRAAQQGQTRIDENGNKQKAQQTNAVSGFFSKNKNSADKVDTAGRNLDNEAGDYGQMYRDNKGAITGTGL